MFSVPQQLASSNLPSLDLGFVKASRDEFQCSHWVLSRSGYPPFHRTFI
jgi:hypothetical protein